MRAKLWRAGQDLVVKKVLQHNLTIHFAGNFTRSEVALGYNVSICISCDIVRLSNLFLCPGLFWAHGVCTLEKSHEWIWQEHLELEDQAPKEKMMKTIYFFLLTMWATIEQTLTPAEYILDTGYKTAETATFNVDTHVQNWCWRQSSNICDFLPDSNKQNVRLRLAKLAQWQRT